MVFNSSNLNFLVCLTISSKIASNDWEEQFKAIYKSTAAHFYERIGVFIFNLENRQFDPGRFDPVKR